MTVLVRIIDRLGAVNERVTHGAQRTAGVLLAIMLVVVMSQVIFRYLLRSSLSWSEEVSKSLMVWSVFFVAPWAYRNGSNVAIEALQGRFSLRFRAGVQVVLNAIVLWLLARFFWESLFFVARGQTITAASLPITMSWIYLVTPVAFVTMFLVGLEILLRHAVVLISQTPPTLRPIRPEEDGPREGA